MTPAGPLKLVSLALLRLLGSFLLWTLWLALTLLLALQIYLATSPQLTVPRELLRPWEDRLAFAGLRATFDRVRFDPSGGISVEKLAVVSLTSGESLAT